jgi:undecaprenyl-diphosphatase
MTAISWMAGSWGMTLVVTAALLGFCRARRLWPEGVALLVAAAGGVGLMIALKALFHRPRPAEIFSHLGYSFPSGHSFFALTIYGMLAYRLSRYAPPRHRPLIWAVAAALVLLVGFSRVFLGVHYPSDVTAGFLVALPWLWGCLALPGWLGRHRPEELTAAAAQR